MRRLSPEAANPVAEVAEGIFRVTIPVPFQGLGAVQCYLLRGAGGYALVDTGLHTPEATAAWETAWETLGFGPGALERILLTHAHPDHYGMAGRLQAEARKAGAKGDVPVHLSAREHELARAYFQTDWRVGGRDPVDDFFARCGVPPAARAPSEHTMHWMVRATRPHPDRVVPIAYGETLVVGTRRLTALHTPGHSDGHLAFFDAADRLLLIGDQVLPHITPNVGLWPGAEPDPLRRYLASLHALHALDVRRALPGHGGVFTNWRERLREIEAHHAERLALMREAAAPGATVYDVARQAFDVDALHPEELRFAVAETLAHLEYLVGEGVLVRREDAVWQYRRAA
jgi:glyoxylase-like metal-dependent hydrolase (beta-lactamase superfamily II)